MDLRLNLLSLIGVYIFCLLAWLLSTDRKNIPWNTLKWGLGLPFFLVFLFLSFPFLLSFLSYIAVPFQYIYRLPYSNESSFPIDFLNSIYRDGNIIKSLGGTLLLVIYFGFLSSTKFLQKYISITSNFFNKTFLISGEVGIVSIFSFFFSFETIFLIFGSLKNMGRSQLFTLITVITSSSSVFFVSIHSHSIESIFPNIQRHLVFSSFLTVFSAILVSKIIYPENFQKEPPSIKSHSLPFWEISRMGAKFIGGILLGGFLILCILNFAEGIFSFLGNFKDTKVLPNDPLFTAFMKTIKLGFNEVFQKITLKNLMALCLLPFCFLSGISFEMVELWRISLIFSQSLLGYPDKFLDLVLMYKDGIYSDRSILLSFYLLNGSTSLPFLGMIYGGLLSVLPEKSNDLYALFLRTFPAAILAQFITASVLGIFDFGNPMVF